MGNTYGNIHVARPSRNVTFRYYHNSGNTIQLGREVLNWFLGYGDDPYGGRTDYCPAI